MPWLRIFGQIWMSSNRLKKKKIRGSAAAHKSKKRDILSKRVHDPSKLPRSASTWQWIGTRVLFALKIYDQLYGQIK